MQRILTAILALTFGVGTAGAQLRTSDAPGDGGYGNSGAGDGSCGTSLGCEISNAPGTTPSGNFVWGDDPDEDFVILDGPVFVKEGATLEIRPGTIVRGQPRYSPVLAGSVRGTPGVLLVTQSGEINAVGNPLNPIIFTTAAVDNDGDGVADDLNGDDELDQYPGFTTACVSGDPVAGPDNILGGNGAADDDLGTCVLSATPTFLDADPANAPLAPLDANGDSNVALWGGLVILGSAPTNLDDQTTGQVGQGLVEGFVPLGYRDIDLTYGGVLPHDSSGAMQYTSVRHGGDEVDDGNELNGITLGGVGDGTVFSFNEVYANQDDGFEWFGGTMNSNNLVVNYIGDDSFDVDQGYTGVSQFTFSISSFFNEQDCDAADCSDPTGGDNFFGSRSGDNAFELDGDDSEVNLAGQDSISPLTDGFDVCNTVSAGTYPSPLPQSAAFFYNSTVMGNNLPSMGGVEFDPNAVCTGLATPLACCTAAGDGFCTAGDNRGLNMKAGFAGELRSSIVINTGSALALDIEPDSGASDCWKVKDNICSNFDPRTGTAAGDAEDFGDGIRIAASTFRDTTIPAGDGSYCNGDTADAQDALSNGQALTGPGLAGNVVNVAFSGLENEDTTFDPQGDGGVLNTSLRTNLIDPRPTGVVGTAQPIDPGGHPVPNPGVSYRGAFEPQAPVLWIKDWTVLSIAGLSDDDDIQ
ncbi:MAG: hypothetical protein QNK04_13390 [Myxococcota bacterium]|nr:hypothetical protein [Myxococcota bacterium]